MRLQLMPPPKISFIIPFIHEYPNLYSTINNIQTEMRESTYDWEIIAVENGTVDENTDHAFTGQRALYRGAMAEGKIRYFFDPIQCGPHARNTGARNATGDYVMFMDAHTSLGKNSIEPLAFYLERHPGCGGIGGLTSWSHWDKWRMGAYYELFLDPKRQLTGEGGPTLLSHMHGHYMPLGLVRPHPIDRPFEVGMGSQAYTMYRRQDFLDIGGYLDTCRFYPHPEGYMPLKMWLSGKSMVVHPESWHIHGMFPRSYSLNQDETQRKIKEYGGLSWGEHGLRNVLMVAYVLGGEKWINLCAAHLKVKRKDDKATRFLEDAVKTVEDHFELNGDPRKKFKFTLDEVLTSLRTGYVMGMEQWLPDIGVDPLG